MPRKTGSTPRYPKRSTASAAGRKWLSVEDILQELGVERRTWQEWRAKGRTPQCVRLPNGKLRIRADHFEEWLAELEETA